jgi:transcription antitermination protein NusB
MTSRHSARIAAVEVLYGADVRGCDALELLDDREDADAFCRHLVEAVSGRREELDRLIGSHARNWATERMSVVDRNVLRVGTVELLEGDVPAAAVIDEAVEIAKHFSGAEAGRFVNGVLEAVRQELDGGVGAGGGGGGPGHSSSFGSSSDVDGSGDGSGGPAGANEGAEGAEGAGGTGVGGS